MGIVNGDLIDADELMDAYGSNFNDTAQMIFNADYIGYDYRLNNNTFPALKNVNYSTFTSDDGDTGTDMKYDFNGDFYFIAGDVIDEIDDSSVDTNLWSKTGAGTLTENTSYLTTGGINNTISTILLDQVNAPNLKDGDSSIYTHTQFTTDAQNGSKDYWIEISDGSNTITLINYDESGSTDIEENHIYRFDIDVSAETVDVYIDGRFDSQKNISSLTGSDWNLRWKTSSGSTPTTNIRIFWVYQISDSTTATADYISQDYTSSETITHAILIANTNVSANATATYFLSADGGSNYEEVTPNEIHRFTDTGTTLKIKVTGDPNKQTDVFDFYSLTEYAVKFNYY